MSQTIPRGALVLGVAGLIPFVWGAISALGLAITAPLAMALGPIFSGTYVSLTYGTVILAFMSGVLWGFAAKGTDPVPYALSVIPALWSFIMVNGQPADAAINLAAGFLGLLAMDYSFSRQGLTPPWWMRLRVGLTAVVLACLCVPIFLE